MIPPSTRIIDMRWPSLQVGIFMIPTSRQEKLTSVILSAPLHTIHRPTYTFIWYIEYRIYIYIYLRYIYIYIYIVLQYSFYILPIYHQKVWKYLSVSIHLDKYLIYYYKFHNNCSKMFWNLFLIRSFIKRLAQTMSWSFWKKL